MPNFADSDHVIQYLCEECGLGDLGWIFRQLQSKSRSETIHSPCDHFSKTNNYLNESKIPLFTSDQIIGYLVVKKGLNDKKYYDLFCLLQSLSHSEGQSQPKGWGVQIKGGIL